MIQVVIRSSLFAAFQLLLTPVFAVIALLTFPLPALTRYRIITVWTCWVMWASRVICGIRYRVIGAENIPQQPCIILAGFYIVIFPEGTRIAPGKRGKYRAGGARLAVQTGTPVLPVAHNAGLRWGKNAFLKYPGMITVSIGPLIQPDDNAESLTRRVEDWIENEMPHLDTR